MIKKYHQRVFVHLRSNFPLYLIFSLILAFHLYRGANLFFWHVDEDIVGLTMKRILVDHRPQLIGFPFPGGIYPGPAIYYLLAFVYVITSMNPLWLPVVSAFIATLTSYLVFYTGRDIFKDSRAGLFAATIFGFSFLSNTYSRFLNGLTFAQIFALLAYLILAKSVKLKSPAKMLLLGLVLILSVQNEGSSISVFLLILVSFFIFKINLQFKYFFILLLLFLVFHLPLLVFETRHEFVLSEKLIGFLTTSSGQSSISLFAQNLVRNLLVFPLAFIRFFLPSGNFDVVNQILPCSELYTRGVFSHPFFIVLSSVVLVVLTSLLAIGRNLGGKIIALHLVILLAGLTVYSWLLGSYEYEWITVIFFPGYALMVGFFLSKVATLSRLSKRCVFIFIGVFLLLNLRAVLSMHGKFGLQDKVSAVQYAVSKVDDSTFFLDSIGSCYEQGYNYLFWYFKNPPEYTKNLIIDPLLTGQKEEIKTETGVVMVSHHRDNNVKFYDSYAHYKSREISHQMFNGIEVLIVDNP